MHYIKIQYNLFSTDKKSQKPEDKWTDKANEKSRMELKPRGIHSCL